MGGGYSKDDEDLFMSELFNLAQEHGLMPDIGIDGSLMKFSGLNSTAVLEDYSSQLLTDLADKAPNYIASLGSVLTSFKGVPNAVGLGALIISFILDLAIFSLAMDDGDSTLNMMRRVFAEEKASGVRDSMDEYMKRLRMHMWEPLKAQEETERLEKQLSDQLTRLRNSMLQDDQMSTRAMKQWTNGAAFHSQMLVHAARLKMAESRPIVETELKVRMASIGTVVEIYQEDLQELLKKYKTHKRKTIALEKASTGRCYRICDLTHCRVRDYEQSSIILPGIRHDTAGNRYCEKSLDAYLDYMFTHWDLIKKMDGFFLELKMNLRELILQHQPFSVLDILPGSDTVHQ